MHEGAAIEVLGVVRKRMLHEGCVNIEADAIGIYLVRYRDAGQAREWIVVGTLTEYLDMIRETVSRVSDVLRGLLADGAE